MSYGVSDLVKVVRMPERQAVPFKDYTGGIGIIEQLVQMLNPAGQRNGALFLPIDCLVAATDTASLATLAAYQQLLADEARERAEWRAMRRAHVLTVAEKHGMAINQVIAVLDDVLGYDAPFYY